MQAHLKSLLKLFFGWPLSLLALFFILQKILPNASQIIENLQHINYVFILFGAASFFGYYLLRSYVWKMILSGFGHTVTWKESAFRWSSSELKRYIPGNIWSFLGRAVLFQELGVPKGTTGKALLFEAQVILFSAITVSFLGLPFLLEHIFPTVSIPFLKYFFIILLGGVVLLFLFQKQLVSAIRHDIKQVILAVVSPFSVGENLKVLSLSAVAFFLFGLGYYFSISSFLFLHPDELFEFIGFFVFSLLIGLLSFITPTGLGVREGMVAFGLSKMVHVSIAGFAALFTRILLIISELFFLLLMYLWEKRKNSFFFEKKLQQYPWESFLIFGIILYTLYFTTVSFLRYDNFYTGRFDLGNMAQTVWNTAHGNIFQITNPNGTESISRLAFHADFILILLAPFYWIWENPKMLLLIQTVVMAFGSWYLYRIGEFVLKRKDIPVMFALLFLLNPSLQRVNLYDFHAVALSSTFLLACFYYLLQRRYGLFFVFAFLAGITKEQVWFIIALFGGYIFLFQQKKVLGLSIFFASCIIGYTLISYFIPHALGTGHFALAYYAEDVSSPAGLLKKTLFSPIETLDLLLSKERVDYLHQLLQPLGYLPLASPFLLIFAGPDLAINLLSRKPELHQIYYQYTATITPFLFIAALYGFRSIQKYLIGEKPWLLVSVFLLVSIWGVYRYSPLPGMRWANTAMFTRQQEYRVEIDAYLSRIPLRYSVAASNNIASHLSHRKNIYVIPIGVEKADYVVFLLNDSSAKPSLRWHKAKAEELRNGTSHILIFERGECLVFRKRNLH